MFLGILMKISSQKFLPISWSVHLECLDALPWIICLDSSCISEHWQEQPNYKCTYSILLKHEQGRSGADQPSVCCKSSWSVMGRELWDVSVTWLMVTLHLCLTVCWQHVQTSMGSWGITVTCNCELRWIVHQWYSLPKIGVQVQDKTQDKNHFLRLKTTIFVTEMT